MLSQGARSRAPPTPPAMAGASFAAQGLAQVLQRGSSVCFDMEHLAPHPVPRMINELSGTPWPGLPVPRLFLAGGTIHLTGAPWAPWPFKTGRDKASCPLGWLQQETRPLTWQSPSSNSPCHFFSLHAWHRSHTHLGCLPHLTSLTRSLKRALTLLYKELWARRAQYLNL